MRKLSYLLVVMLFVSLGTRAQDDILKKLEAIAVIDQKVMMPMRDGVRLATDIYRPKGDKPVPIIFSRTPYNFNSWGTVKCVRETTKQLTMLFDEDMRM